MNDPACIRVQSIERKHELYTGSFYPVGKVLVLGDPDAVRVHGDPADALAPACVKDRKKVWMEGWFASRKVDQLDPARRANDVINDPLCLFSGLIVFPVRAIIREADGAVKVAVVGDGKDRKIQAARMPLAGAAVERAAPPRRQPVLDLIDRTRDARPLREPCPRAGDLDALDAPCGHILSMKTPVSRAMILASSVLLQRSQYARVDRRYVSPLSIIIYRRQPGCSGR